MSHFLACGTKSKKLLNILGSAEQQRLDAVVGAGGGISDCCFRAASAGRAQTGPQQLSVLTVSYH